MTIGLENFFQNTTWRTGLKKIGLLMNHSAVTSSYIHAFQLFAQDTSIHVKAIFGPEHGIWGVAQDMETVGNEKEPLTGAPVYSLYGDSFDTLTPSMDIIADLDAVIYDIQDVGSRYYTYAATLVMLLNVCNKTNTKVIVLDRPNPINGVAIEGNFIEEGFNSFVGTINVPQRHGLTVGELAMYYKQTNNIACDLAVVPVTDWKRELYLDQTPSPWGFPSPNMPTMDTAVVYPGGCLFEATNISEGRGTTKPFEIIGAPFVESYLLAKTVSTLQLPGVIFQPTYFKPTFQKHAGDICGGVFIHVIDRMVFNSLKTGVALLWQINQLWPDDFSWRSEAYEFVDTIPAVDLLAGNDTFRIAFEAGKDFKTCWQIMNKDADNFKAMRKEFLLY